MSSFQCRSSVPFLGPVQRLLAPCRERWMFLQCLASAWVSSSAADLAAARRDRSEVWIRPAGAQQPSDCACSSRVPQDIILITVPNTQTDKASTQAPLLFGSTIPVGADTWQQQGNRGETGHGKNS